MGSVDELMAWLAGRIPAGWFESGPEMMADREEILIVGKLAEPEVAEGASEETLKAAVLGRINQHREDSRQDRMRIASEAEGKFQRKVSWGVECGGIRVMFTNLSVPVMTRLRMPERQVLDRLVDAGIARSRSHALVWCVRLVRQHQGEWLDDLKEALAQVEQVREAGPHVD
jgi:hypothetical protein